MTEVISITVLIVNVTESKDLEELSSNKERFVGKNTMKNIVDHIHAHHGYFFFEEL